MKVNFCKIDSLKKAKGLAVLVLNEDSVKKSTLKFIKKAKEISDFEGKFAQFCQTSFEDEALILVGLGDEKKFDENEAQKLGAKIFVYLNSAKIKEATIFLDVKISTNGDLKSEENPCNLAFGAVLQSYRFNKYFENKKKDKELKTCALYFNCKDENAVEKEFAQFEIVANNIFFVRDLVSEPANILNPESYAEICKTLTKEGLEIEILGEKEMKKLQMNALLGVGQGSSKESKLVILKWNGLKNSSQPIAFVGKGVTFDTGGISIKPSTNMEDMKSDMAGSAVVVGFFRFFGPRKNKGK